MRSQSPRPAHRRALVCRTGRQTGQPPPAHAEPVLPGPEPEQQRHGQERRAGAPAPGHRADRQARRGAAVAHRPGQRHGRARGGRHGEFIVRPPGPVQPRAPRRGGRAVGIERRACTAWPHGGGDVPGRRRRRDQGAVDRLHQPGAEHARPGHGAPRPAARRVRGGAGGLCHHRHLRLRRPAVARQHLGRKDRHGDQQRAPHLARAQRRARAGRGAARLADCGAVRAPARSAPAPGPAHAVPLPHAAGRRGRRGPLERAPREHARARPRHHRPELRADRRAGPAAVALCRHSPHRHGAAV